jgi:hypothetical protein
MTIGNTRRAPNRSASRPIHGTQSAPANVKEPEANPAVPKEFFVVETINTMATGLRAKEILPNIPKPKVDKASGLLIT